MCVGGCGLWDAAHLLQSGHETYSVGLCSCGELFCERIVRYGHHTPCTHIRLRFGGSNFKTGRQTASESERDAAAHFQTTPPASTNGGRNVREHSESTPVTPSMYRGDKVSWCLAHRGCVAVCALPVGFHCYMSSPRRSREDTPPVPPSQHASKLHM